MNSRCWILLKIWNIDNILWNPTTPKTETCVLLLFLHYSENVMLRNQNISSIYMYEEASFSKPLFCSNYNLLPYSRKSQVHSYTTRRAWKKKINSISRHTELHFELRKCAKGTAGNLVAFHNEVITVLQSLLNL